MSRADVVTALRALAAVPVWWAIANDERAIGAAVFVLAALSDALDGWLARRYGSAGGRGAFIDPMADKILVVSALIALALAQRVDPYLVMAVVLRELVVASARAFTHARGFGVTTSGAAKLKTACEMSAIVLLIAAPPPSLAGAGLLVAALVIGLVTMPHYLPRRADRLA